MFILGVCYFRLFLVDWCCNKVVRYVGLVFFFFDFFKLGNYFFFVLMKCFFNIYDNVCEKIGLIFVLFL